MTPDQNQDNVTAHISQALLQDTEGMATLVEIFLNAMMKAERSEALAAEPYQRTEQRKGERRFSMAV